MTTLAQVFAEADQGGRSDTGLVKMEMVAPFGWPGGKARLKKRILPLILPHKTYVEPFAGAASVSAGRNNIKGKELLIANYPIGRHGMEQGGAAQPDMAVLGPAAWAELHAWADRFAAKVGDSCGCGLFAQDAARALHDVVNVRLGKKVLDRENLLAFWVEVEEAIKQSDSMVQAGQAGMGATGVAPGVRPQQEHGIYPWPEGVVDDEEEEVDDEGMEQTANPVTKAILRPFEGKSLTLAEVRALPHRAATLRALLEGYIGEHPLPEGMMYFLTAKGEIFLAEKRKAPHLAQSFLDTILHTAIGTGVAIGVSKVLNSPTSSIIKEEEKPKDDPPVPSVLSPAHVDGDQANVDLGTLLEEIDAILKKPETMGIVDADTLTIVRA